MDLGKLKANHLNDYVEDKLDYNKIMSGEKQITTVNYLDELRVRLDESANFLFTSKLIVDENIRELVLSIVDAFPAELREAHAIIQSMKELVRRAEEEKERILHEAQEMADNMINESRIVKEAQEKADAMIQSAVERDKASKEAVRKYINDLFDAAQSAFSNLDGQLKESKNFVLEQMETDE